MEPNFKKESAPDFSKPEIESAFVNDVQNAEDLLRKELDVNVGEQKLLQERIRMTNELINDIPKSDPQYGMLTIQRQMDQIELDELNRRKEAICQQLRGLLE